MGRIKAVKELLEKNAEIKRCFTIREDEGDAILLISAITLGKVGKKQAMYMRVRDGEGFCVISAHLCEINGDKIISRMYPLINRINSQYMGARAYLLPHKRGKNEGGYTFVMSIENYFDATDENPQPLFELDRMLTSVLELEYDNIMRQVYS